MSFHVADLRALPLASGSADLVLAGWAVSYLKSEHEEWYADGSSGGPWRGEVDAALSEMERVLAPGGTLVVLETLGTATATPQRAGSWLYAHLRERGLIQQVVRTDYRFPSKRAALGTLLFFFGKGVARRAEALLAAVADDGEPCVVPECTGMWWRQKDAFANAHAHAHADGREPRHLGGPEAEGRPPSAGTPPSASAAATAEESAGSQRTRRLTGGAAWLGLAAVVAGVVASAVLRSHKP